MHAFDNLQPAPKIFAETNSNEPLVREDLKALIGKLKFAASKGTENLPLRKNTLSIRCGISDDKNITFDEAYPKDKIMITEFLGQFMQAFLYPSEEGQIRSEEERAQTISLPTEHTVRKDLNKLIPSDVTISLEVADFATPNVDEKRGAILLKRLKDGLIDNAYRAVSKSLSLLIPLLIFCSCKNRSEMSKNTIEEHTENRSSGGTKNYNSSLNAYEKTIVDTSSKMLILWRDQEHTEIIVDPTGENDWSDPDNYSFMFDKRDRILSYRLKDSLELINTDDKHTRVGVSELNHPIIRTVRFAPYYYDDGKVLYFFRRQKGSNYEFEHIAESGEKKLQKIVLLRTKKDAFNYMKHHLGISNPDSLFAWPKGK